jgi:hypothetical protein
LRLPLKGESMRKLTSPLTLQEEVSPPWANYLSPDNFLSFAHFSFFVSYAFITWLCRPVLRIGSILRGSTSFLKTKAIFCRQTEGSKIMIWAQ